MKPAEREIAEWVVSTCLLFGTTIGTAYLLAGEFVKGLQDEARPEGIGE